jgi:hypothetical protein
MVRIEFARGTMVNFTVLGEVTAAWDDEVADLRPQQQLLLARLICAGGARVGRDDLMSTLSLGFQRNLPDGGLKRVVAELRKNLRSVMPDEDPIPSEDRGYRLVLAQQQADVFRFRAKSEAARRSTGMEGVKLMRAALAEWAPDATGLFGGCALKGLGSSWATRTSAVLGGEYRHAVVYCLRQELDAGKHQQVLVECERRGLADQEQKNRAGSQSQAPLLDEEFLELWIRAAYLCGQAARAVEVGQWATAAAARFDKAAEFKIRRLVDRLRDEECSSSSTTAGPSGTGRKDRKTMGDPAGTSNHWDNRGARIGIQIGQSYGSIHYHPSSESAGGDSWDDAELDNDNLDDVEEQP